MQRSASARSPSRSACALGAARWRSSRPPTKNSEIRKPSTAAIATNRKPAWIPVANDSRDDRRDRGLGRRAELVKRRRARVGAGEHPVQDGGLVIGQVESRRRRPCRRARSRSVSVKIVVVIPRPIAPPAIWNM